MYESICRTLIEVSPFITAVYTTFLVYVHCTELVSQRKCLTFVFLFCVVLLLMPFAPASEAPLGGLVLYVCGRQHALKRCILLGC